MSVLYKRVELIQTVTLLFRQTVFLAVEVQKNYRRGGIVTGDNHSVSLANITVHYVLQPIADILEQTEVFRRFIDDVCLDHRFRIDKYWYQISSQCSI